MKVVRLEDIVGSENEIDGGNWVSRRLLLDRDTMGFSLHDTLIRADTETRLWYKNHLEAVYCIEGRGEVELVATGEIFPIEAGTVYALDGHEEHLLRAFQEMRMVCVFNPPVTGREMHDEDGAYAPHPEGKPIANR